MAKGQIHSTEGGTSWVEDAYGDRDDAATDAYHYDQLSELYEWTEKVCAALNARYGQGDFKHRTQTADFATERGGFSVSVMGEDNPKLVNAVGGLLLINDEAFCVVANKETATGE